MMPTNKHSISPIKFMFGRPMNLGLRPCLVPNLMDSSYNHVQYIGGLFYPRNPETYSQKELEVPVGGCPLL